MKKYVTAMLAMMTFFSGAVSCARREPATPFAGNTLTVMALNVWSGLDYRGTLSMGEYETPEVRESRYRALLAELRRHSPDIIGVNEANFLPDYVERLAGDIGYDFMYHVGVSGARIGRVGVPWNLREGDAILARRGLGLKYVGRKHLGGGGFVRNWSSFHTDDATQVVLGSVKAGGKEIYVAVTHLHASPDDTTDMREKLASLAKELRRSAVDVEAAEARLRADNEWRAAEVKALLAYLADTVPKGAPVILMGDFNAVISSPEMKPLVDAGYLDTYAVHVKNSGVVAGLDSGFTWDPVLNLNIRKHYSGKPDDNDASLYDYLSRFKETRRSRIDFIFLNSSFAAKVVESSVCADRKMHGVHPSDHFGVVTKIELAAAPSASRATAR